MAKFITTVHLQQAGEKDYEKLNSEMLKASFYLKKTLTGGKMSDLKNGEYNSRKYINVPEVADAVYKAVKKTGRNYSFSIVKGKAGYASLR